MKNNKEIKENKIEVTEKIIFTFMQEKNARNVAFALSCAGYYVRILDNELDYKVCVYSIN
ncbi:MAG: hypothetical protein PHF05_06420 [Candidatus Izemoplasmatales bacterium]|nr:hypothetical protein [Candidatus Izemoplasmatales bacterium]